MVHTIPSHLHGGFIGGLKYEVEMETWTDENVSSKLKAFTYFFGDNYDRRDESKFLPAFQDFVYYSNFGWVEGIDGLPASLGQKSFHESSLCCSEREIIVEDIMEIAVKVWTARDSARATDPQVASPVFHSVDESPQLSAWIEQFKAAYDTETAARLSHCQRNAIFRLPPLSCPTSVSEVEISNESLILIAMRAGCFCLHRDSYLVLRQVATEYMTSLLKSVGNSSSRDLITACDVQRAIKQFNGHTLVGYGYKGFKRFFEQELIQLGAKLRLCGKIDSVALAVLSDLMCLVFDTVVGAAAAQASQTVQLLVVAEVTSSDNTGICGKIVIANPSSANPPCKMVGREAPVSRVLAAPMITAAVEHTFTGKLAQHAIKDSIREIELYERSTLPWQPGQGMRQHCELIVSPEKFIQLAAELFPDIVFTDEAVLFVTRTLEYVIGELIELAGNTPGANVPVRTSDLMSSVEVDNELKALFGALWYRDKVATPVHHEALDLQISEEAWRKLDEFCEWEAATPGFEGTPHNMFFARSYSEFMKATTGDNGAFVDHRTGLHMVANKLFFQHNGVAEIIDRTPRKHRRKTAISNCTSKSLLDLLAKEYPLDASLESLRRLNLRKVSFSFRDNVMQNTSIDMDKSAVLWMVRNICESQSFTGQRDQNFTHEALNALQLALEYHLCDVLKDANGNALASGVGILHPEQIIESANSSALVLAAKQNNREMITMLLSRNCNLNSHFKRENPLSVACDNDNAEFLDWLVERGAQLNCHLSNPVYSYSSNEKRILLRAVHDDRKNIVRTLLQKYAAAVDFHVRNEYGDTVLTVLAKRRPEQVDTYFLDLVDEFISKGVDVNEGYPLYHACAAGNIAVAEKLICYGADVEKAGEWETRKPIDLLRSEEDKLRFRRAQELFSCTTLK